MMEEEEENTSEVPEERFQSELLATVLDAGSREAFNKSYAELCLLHKKLGLELSGEEIAALAVLGTRVLANSGQSGE